VAVEPRSDEIVACVACRRGMAGDIEEAHRWRCLNETAWSEHPAVQVVSWRVLGRISEPWASELQEQLYLDDDTAIWAREGSGDGDMGPVAKTVDSNGTELLDGDSVTLIKDLDVKGAGFTAKRGTLVKGIKLSDDPELIEGRVQKTVIYLRTEFLKKA